MLFTDHIVPLLDSQNCSELNLTMTIPLASIIAQMHPDFRRKLEIQIGSLMSSLSYIRCLQSLTVRIAPGDKSQQWQSRFYWKLSGSSSSQPWEYVSPCFGNLLTYAETVRLKDTVEAQNRLIANEDDPTDDSTTDDLLINDQVKVDIKTKYSRIWIVYLIRLCHLTKSLSTQHPKGYPTSQRHRITSVKRHWFPTLFSFKTEQNSNTLHGHTCSHPTTIKTTTRTE